MRFVKVRIVSLNLGEIVWNISKVFKFVRLSAQWSSSAQWPKINSNQTKGWSQAITARLVELENEIWFKKRF